MAARPPARRRRRRGRAAASGPAPRRSAALDPVVAQRRHRRGVRLPRLFPAAARRSARQPVARRRRAGAALRRLARLSGLGADAEDQPPRPAVRARRPPAREPRPRHGRACGGRHHRRPGRGPVTFEELYRAHVREVTRFAFYLAGDASAAEDIAAETFVRAWAADAPARSRSLRAYLFAIARNLNRRRHALAQRERPLDEAGEAAGGDLE